MLSDHELAQIQEAGDKLLRPVTIHIGRGGVPDAFANNLESIGRQINGVSMNRIAIDLDAESVLAGKPCLSLSSGGVKNVHYVAAPEGQEFGPFVDAIMWLGRAKSAPDGGRYEDLNQLSEPVDLLTLIASMCPHCPKAVRAALSLAAQKPSVSVTIVDAVQFPDMADRYKVKSTPTIIVNGGLTYVGDVSVADLIEGIVGSQAENSLTATLNSMIQSGRAEDAGALLCREDRPEALLPLYLSKEFSSRMGALVAMEAALEVNPRVLDPIVSDLCALLSHEEVGLRGDTAELLGKIGNPVAAPALKEAALDPDPDVREAAMEALEELNMIAEGQA